MSRRRWTPPGSPSSQLSLLLESAAFVAWEGAPGGRHHGNCRRIQWTSFGHACPRCMSKMSTHHRDGAPGGRHARKCCPFGTFARNAEVEWRVGSEVNSGVESGASRAWRMEMRQRSAWRVDLIFEWRVARSGEGEESRVESGGVKCGAYRVECDE